MEKTRKIIDVFHFLTPEDMTKKNLKTKWIDKKIS